MNTEKKSVRINLSAKDIESIELVMRNYSLNSIQDVFRFLATSEALKIKNKIIIYGKSTRLEKKQNIMDRLDELKNMDNKSLTEYIKTLGYEYFFEDRLYDPCDPSCTRMVHHEIIDGDNGRTWYETKYEMNDPKKKIVESREVWSIDELLKELVKRKLI